MTELLIVVPARGGSKRLPRKNVRTLAGRSLLQWTQEAIAEAGLDAPCLLTTDDEEIAAAGRELGWLVPFLRPAELARDDSPTEPAVLHALDWFAAHRHGDPALVMVLQGTSPFRGGGCLREGLVMLRSAPQADAVVAVRKLHGTAAKVFVRDAENMLNPLGTGDQQEVVTPNGALYLIRTRVLRARGTLFPPRTLPLMMDDLASMDIDTELDWSLAEAAATRMGAGRTA